MKNIFYTILFSIITIPSLAQTATELEEKLKKLQLENQSLTLQNTNFDTKIQEKEKELTRTETELKQLQQKRIKSEDACKNISDDDIKLMQGLAGGTTVISLAGTGIGTAHKITGALQNKETKNEDTSQISETNQNTTLKKSTTLDKALNITTTVTSAGATVTSAIALSKVNGLKDDIKNCIDSFN
ncbi:MAG: hypothetical protein ACI4N3_01320 [Alphaproteobacteria bacterium]